MNPHTISKGDIVIIDDMNMCLELGIVDGANPTSVTLSRAWLIGGGINVVGAVRGKRDFGQLLPIGRTVKYFPIVTSWTLNNWAVADLDKLPQE